jgi:hypothetical protein
MSKILSSVSQFLCFNADGSLNWEESSAHIRAAVEAEIEQNAVLDTAILNAVNSVYDRFATNETMVTGDVVAFASLELASLGYARDEIKVRVKEYLDRSKNQFKSQKGRTGGLIRQYK